MIIKIFLAAIVSFFMLTPFFYWIFQLHIFEIPNPFSLGIDLMDNRHSGPLNIISDPKFWTRNLRWLAPKGIGFPAVVGILISLYGILVKKKKEDEPWLLWCLMVVPYWLLIREGNFIHDYYFFPFFFPFAYLGAKNILSLKNKWIKAIIILVSITLGAKEGIYLKTVAISVSDQAPKFCDAETKSYNRK